MLLTDLPQRILFAPIVLGANHLYVISGYATPNMASWYIKNLVGMTLKPISISILVGMAPFDGLSISVHEGFKELMHTSLPAEVGRFSCSYVFNNPPVHSKLYIWLRDDEPIIAFIGSANFTQSAFSTSRREALAECNAKEAFLYYQQIEADSIYCNHAEVEEHIILHPVHPVLDLEGHPLRRLEGSGIKSVRLSLLSRTGETGTRSGINWGQRNARNPNEAYIGLSAPLARSGFFPLNKQHFTAVTDDGHQLILRVEQQNDKAITTPLSNALLGEYLRNRLGVANGAYVTRADLERYGRTDIMFYKLDDEQYYLDFSV